MARPNPEYGRGIFRRSLRLAASSGEVLVELEDCNHAFRLRLSHDGARVTDVTCDTHRFPFVTCPEAAGPVRRVVGCRLDETPTKLRQVVPPGDNCTHLHDMAMLALTHAGKPGLTRRYDIAVADEKDRHTRATIACDGEIVHDWTINQHQVVSPEACAGQAMMRGFFAWVSHRYADMPLEAAVALQRGYYVAQSRRFLSVPPEEHPATVNNMPDGTCYSYNHSVVQRARRVPGSIWDLTDKPDHPLQFRTAP